MYRFDAASGTPSSTARLLLGGASAASSAGLPLVPQAPCRCSCSGCVATPAPSVVPLALCRLLLGPSADDDGAGVEPNDINGLCWLSLVAVAAGRAAPPCMLPAWLSPCTCAWASAVPAAAVACAAAVDAAVAAASPLQVVAWLHPAAASACCCRSLQGRAGGSEGHPGQADQWPSLHKQAGHRQTDMLWPPQGAYACMAAVDAAVDAAGPRCRPL